MRILLAYGFDPVVFRPSLVLLLLRSDLAAGTSVVWRSDVWFLFSLSAAETGALQYRLSFLFGQGEAGLDQTAGNGRTYRILRPTTIYIYRNAMSARSLI